MVDETIGNKTARLRSERGMTKYRLSKLSGLNEAYIGQLEAGRVKHPRRDTLEALAKGLGISVSVFFEEDVSKLKDQEIKDFLVNEFPGLDNEAKDWVRRTINMVRERQRDKYKANKDR